jgi:hypothetical protein
MRTLLLDLRAHRRVVLVALVVWLVLWKATALTWIYDERGYSAGMHPAVFFTHIVLPLAAGGLAGYWRGQPIAGLRAGGLAGLLFALLDYGGLLLWSGLLITLGRVSPDYAPAFAWEPLFEVFEMGLADLLVGLVLGAAGGLVGGLLAARQRPRQPGPRPGGAAAR